MMFLMLIVLYVTIIFIFATSYLWAIHGTNCAKEDSDFGADFATLSRCYFFSLETMMTIGYGTRDPFFEGCEVSMGFILTVQALVGIIMDMCMLGTLCNYALTRISVSLVNGRGITIIVITVFIWYGFLSVLYVRELQLSAGPPVHV